MNNIYIINFILYCMSILIIRIYSAENNSIYSYDIIRQNGSISHSWNVVNVTINNITAHTLLVEEQITNPGIASTSYFIKQPLYVSMTTISIRIEQVYKSIIRIIRGKVVPTHIYLCISEEPFLLDKGIKTLPDNLLVLVAANYLSIIYTENIGPHRKLLPVLKHYWGQDVFIATVDDDLSNYHGFNILYQLLKNHNMHKKEHVIALRARRIGFCQSSPNAFVSSYPSWLVTKNYYQSEMLLLPTGTGGVLYKPKFFHKVVFDKKLWELTQSADDITFRLAAMIKEVPVQLGCTRHIEGVKISIDESKKRCHEDQFDRFFNMKYNYTQYRLNTLYNTNMRHNNSGIHSIYYHNHLMHQQQYHHLNTLRNRQLNTVTSSSSSLEKTIHKKAINSTVLYTINGKGVNNKCWHNAVKYLESKQLLNLNKLVAKYIPERTKSCTENPVDCCIYDCKTKKYLIPNLKY